MHLLIFGAIIHATHAVHQVTVSLPATRALYQKDPDSALEKAGLDAPPGSATRALYESRLLYSTEPVATFALTNSLAVVLSAALVALGIVFVSQWHVHDASTRWAMAFEVAALALLGAAWLLTKSRTAFLSVLPITAVSTTLWMWQHRNTANQPASINARQMGRRWLAAIVVVIVLLFGSALALLSRDTLILSEAPKSIAFRLEYWQASAKMIFDYPLTGVGLGNFQSYYPRYKVATASEIIADPHNWLFDIAATCSLPVLALVVVGVAAALVRSWSMLPFCRSPAREDEVIATASDLLKERSLVRAIWIGAIVGWLVTAILQVALQEMLDLEASIYGVIVGGVVIAMLHSGPQPSPAVLRSAALAAFLTMLVCLLASGSWQASGIALPLAAWLAICCPGANSRRTDNSPMVGRTIAGSHIASRPIVGTSIPVDPRRASNLTGVIMVGVLAAFLLQTWRPVNTSWSLEQNAIDAYSRHDFVIAQERARASIAADPLSPQPRRLLVEILTAQAEQQSAVPLEESIVNIQSALDGLLDCDPSSDRAWVFAAETLMTLAATNETTRNALGPHTTFSRGGHAVQLGLAPLSPETTALLVRADEYCREAIERHPSSISLHAQRAIVLTLMKHAEAAQNELSSAFALSDATPHLDRKLAMQRIWLPPALANFPQQAVVRPVANSAWAMAEPLCNYLRK